MAEPKECPHCHEFKGPGGFGKHVAKCGAEHGVPGTAVVHVKAKAPARVEAATPTRVQWKRMAQAQDDLLTVVAFTFPRGIETDDRAHLARALRWVEDTRELLEVR